MSMWSLNRDATCGSNYADLRRVSDACSGIDQGDAALRRRARLRASPVDRRGGRRRSPSRSDAGSGRRVVDDPATSPYPIWTLSSTYLAGTKVVWHRNVYQAKWWTRGDLPDDPVLNEWETPWNLIGPVLAGEKPVEIPTLPYGVYPEWEGTDDLRSPGAHPVRRPGVRGQVVDAGR